MRVRRVAGAALPRRLRCWPTRSAASSCTTWSRACSAACCRCGSSRCRLAVLLLARRRGFLRLRRRCASAAARAEPCSRRCARQERRDPLRRRRHAARGAARPRGRRRDASPRPAAGSARPCCATAAGCRSATTSSHRGREHRAEPAPGVEGGAHQELPAARPDQRDGLRHLARLRPHRRRRQIARARARARHHLLRHRARLLRHRLRAASSARR